MSLIIFYRNVCAGGEVEKDFNFSIYDLDLGLLFIFTLK